MRQWFFLLHILGIIGFFGTAVGDLFYMPAAKKGDVNLRDWTYSNYLRSMRFEQIGLLFLVVGGIGLLIDNEWTPWEFPWLLIKLIAVAVLIIDRGLVAAYLARYFSPKAATGGDQKARVEKGVAWIDWHAKVTGPIVAIAGAVVFWMIIWRPDF